MSKPQSLEDVVSRLLAARAERDELRYQRSKFRCEKESRDRGPCWKAIEVPGEVPARVYRGRSQWCKSCTARQRVHTEYRGAVLRAGHAMRAFWQTAKAVIKRSELSPTPQPEASHV